MLIRDVKLDPNSIDLQETLTQLINEALTQANWQEELSDLALRAFLDENLLPWTVAIRGLAEKGKLNIDIIDHLLMLFSTGDVPVALGALSLIIAINQTVNYELTDDLLQAAIKRKQKKDNARIRALNYLYTSENINTRNIAINNLKAEDDNWMRLTKEIEESGYIPFAEMLKAYATDSNSNQLFNQIMFFIEHSVSTRQVNRLCSEYFTVFNQGEEEAEQRTKLLKLIELAGQQYQSANVGLFVNNILDNEHIRNLFVQVQQAKTTDILRPIAVSGADQKLRKWTRKLIKRIRFTEAEEYQLVARGELSRLNEVTLHRILDLYKDALDKPFEYEVLLPKSEGPMEEELIANRTRRLTDQKSVPVNLQHIAERYGIKVIYIEDSYSEGFDGCLFRAPNLPFPLVFCNTYKIIPARQRFTLGHELAHYLLVHSYNSFCCSTNEWLWSNSPTKSDEIAADKFSAALLMPLSEISRDVKYGIGNWQRVRELQQKYQVSTIALACRLVEANQISSAILRFTNGKVTLSRCSKRFGLNYAAVPRYGSLCPRGTGAMEIYKGQMSEFEGEVPIERWIDSRYLSVSSRLKLNEQSILVGNEILTLLEIDSPDYYGPNDSEDDDHLNYINDQKKGFGIGALLKEERERRR